MFLFFTLLDTFYFLSPVMFNLAVIVCLTNKLTKQENLIKICDLFNCFRSLLFAYQK